MNSHEFLFISILTLTLLTSQGCISKNPVFSSSSREISSLNYDSAALDKLVQEMTEEFSTVSKGESGSPLSLFITTIVDLNDLKKTSAFGRLVSERLMTTMVDEGFRVVEGRKGSNIYIIENQGEMLLTRNPEAISDKIRAGAIIYGTYLVSEQEVLLTVRLARSSDFTILRSWNGRMERNPLVDQLLEDSPGVEVYERIPKRE